MVGTHESLPEKKWGAPFLESLHPKRVGFDSRVACPIQGKFCHFVNARSFVAVKDL